METRTLGSELFTTSAIGFGCMGLSQGYGPTDDTKSIATLQAALDAGITMFDTAQSYGDGHNERLVGETLRNSSIDRSAYNIATKMGITRHPDGVALDADPTHVAGFCDASLGRLGVDHIDLYYLHRPDPRFPIEESIGEMANLVKTGKVRHLGVSEVTSDQLERAVLIHPITAVQTEWSMMWREPELVVVPTARRLGVGIVAYSPLGRGLLSATLSTETVATSPFRSSDPRFIGDSLHTNMSQVEGLARLADRWDTTPSQIALAWLLAQGPDVVPIPGSRRSARMLENIGATNLLLDAGKLIQLENTVPSNGWVGNRHSFAVPTTTRPIT